MKLANVLLPEGPPEPYRKHLNLLPSQINAHEDLSHEYNFSDYACTLEPKIIRRQIHVVHVEDARISNWLVMGSH